MSHLCPRICPVCDRQYDEHVGIDETTRDLFFHYFTKQTCITEKDKEPITMAFGYVGVYQVRD